MPSLVISSPLLVLPPQTPLLKFWLSDFRFRQFPTCIARLRSAKEWSIPTVRAISSSPVQRGHIHQVNQIRCLYSSPHFNDLQQVGTAKQQIVSCCTDKRGIQLSHLRSQVDNTRSKILWSRMCCMIMLNG